MRLENSMPIFLIFLQLCVVYLYATPSSAADSQYETCSGPRNCGQGPNISFPFYIEGLQESYCGFPGFMLRCNDHGFPVIDFAETKYVVQDIFYETRSFRVHDSATLASNKTDCVPRIRNTTLPKPQFEYESNVTNLNLWSNCNDSWSQSRVSSQIVVCDGSRIWGIYDKDEGMENAFENCGGNLVVPVEEDGDMGVGNVVQVLRRGFVIKWTASDCSGCRDSGGYCGFNDTSYVFKCFCPDRPHSRTCKPDTEKSHSRLILITAVSGTAVFLLLCLSTSLIIWRQCKKRLKPSSFLSRNTSAMSKSDIEGGTTYFGIPIFSYKELVEATNNFDSSKEVGDGGFGTVYYGKLGDGREVAVKRLHERNNRRVEQFMNEIEVLAGMRHKNLVSLYGCTSSRSRELLLVYEYIANGTVADHLHGDRAKEAPLNWPVRMKIAIETASALAYLHRSDIIHRDVKTNNILLDDNFCVKVADFGLSRLFPNDVTHISTAPQGTPGYVDPSYYQCYQLTNKSDVYSFGVVLIELVSSMPAVDITRHSSEINLANLAINRIQTRTFDKLIDSSLGCDSDVEVARMATSVAELAFRCLQVEKELRPSMDEVVSFLKEIQSGGEIEFEIKKEGNGNVLHSVSPETDDVILLKNKNFKSSPNAVIDRWFSSSTTRSSFNKSVGTI